MTKYTAMWNMPEMEPAAFDTFEEARAFIVDELGREQDNCLVQDCPKTAEAYTQSIEEVLTFGGPFSIIPEANDNGYVYSVDTAE